MVLFAGNFVGTFSFLFGRGVYWLFFGVTFLWLIIGGNFFGYPERVVRMEPWGGKLVF